MTQIGQFPIAFSVWKHLPEGHAGKNQKIACEAECITDVVGIEHGRPLDFLNLILGIGTDVAMERGDRRVRRIRR